MTTPNVPVRSEHVQRPAEILCFACHAAERYSDSAHHVDPRHLLTLARRCACDGFSAADFRELEIAVEDFEHWIESATL